MGIWGVLRDEAIEKINNHSLLETVTGNFNSLMSQKDSLFYLSRTAPQKRLSTVNRAACQAAPSVREAQNLRISLLNSLLAGKWGTERGLLETASTTNHF